MPSSSKTTVHGTWGEFEDKKALPGRNESDSIAPRYTSQRGRTMHLKGMKFLPKPKGFTFHVGRPQRLAAVLLLLFFGQCLWVIGHQRPTTEDYRYARCGREM